MNHTLLRGCALLLLGVGVFVASPAHAAITCSASMSSVSFGNVDPQSTQTDTTATLSYTCSNDQIVTYSATVCFSIGEPNNGPTNPRQMEDGSAHTLDFQLYRNPARAFIWGSQFSGFGTPLLLNLRLPPRPAIVSGSATMYGRVSRGQAAVIPGAYTNVYAAGDTRLTINPSLAGGSAPASCNENPTQDTRFPFTVSASVINKCTVTASPLEFGNGIGLLTTAMNASTTLGVQCSIGTAYHVALNAGQNSGGNIDARKMVLAGSSVSYQLYQDPGRTVVWGNTVGSNTLSGTGTGNTQSLTVFGRVPSQATPPAGTYNDTVTVTVTY